MEILGFVLAALMGCILGLLGAGGSMLTLPILIYIHHTPTVLATGYALVIVGTTAFVGAMQYASRRQVDYVSLATFGIPAICGVYLARRWLLPAVPEHIFSVGSWDFEKGTLILLLFGIEMLSAAILMLWKKPHDTPKKRSIGLVGFSGILVGICTGFVGAGGGFMIVPALVGLSGLSMTVAVGTSLSIVAAKSLVGFLGDVHAGANIDWVYLLTFTIVAIGGMVLGILISYRVDAKKLKPVFGYFVLAMALFILVKQFVA